MSALRLFAPRANLSLHSKQLQQRLLFARHASTAPPPKPRLLEKPERFNPPSHPARLRAKPKYYGPSLSEHERKAQRKRQYPRMFPPEGSFMFWFLTNRSVHTYLSLSILLSLVFAIWFENFIHSTPYRDLLPPNNMFLAHPITFLGRWAEVYQMHVDYFSQITDQRRKQKTADVAKRAAYRKAHGMEKQGILGSLLGKEDEPRSSPPAREGGIEGAAIGNIDEASYVDFEGRPQPSRKKVLVHLYSVDVNEFNGECIISNLHPLYQPFRSPLHLDMTHLLDATRVMRGRNLGSAECARQTREIVGSPTLVTPINITLHNIVNNMKVGKPKSKRVPVRLRHKIEKSSAAKGRKQRKEAKKNPQWRSRLKKDPGIPNLFPYKAKVLAEIEEGKRLKAEELQRRRETAKAQRLGTVVAEAGESEGLVGAREEDDDEVLDDAADQFEDEEDMDEQDDGGNPMAALVASAQARAHAYSHEDDVDDDDAGDVDDEADEWDSIKEGKTAAPFVQPQRKALPAQALADPIKAVSALLERMQNTQDGIRHLLDHYQVPPLATKGTDFSARFLVEVARKRGRLGRGGVPNLHAAALAVLGDLSDQRLVLPAVAASKKVTSLAGKGEVKIVSQMAEPFRIEGLWGEDKAVSGAEEGSEMAVQA